jgi:hypothetical protein
MMSSMAVWQALVAVRSLPDGALVSARPTGRTRSCTRPRGDQAGAAHRGQLSFQVELNGVSTSMDFWRPGSAKTTHRTVRWKAPPDLTTSTYGRSGAVNLRPAHLANKTMGRFYVQLLARQMNLEADHLLYLQSAIRRRFSVMRKLLRRATVKHTSSTRCESSPTSEVVPVLILARPARAAEHPTTS